MKHVLVIWFVEALCAAGCYPTKVPIETARQIALASVAGEVTRENRNREHGRVIYEFRIKPAGEQRQIVKEVEIDANTGEVIDVEDEPAT